MPRYFYFSTLILFLLLAGFLFLSPFSAIKMYCTVKHFRVKFNRQSSRWIFHSSTKWRIRLFLLVQVRFSCQRDVERSRQYIYKCIRIYETQSMRLPTRMYASHWRRKKNDVNTPDKFSAWEFWCLRSIFSAINVSNWRSYRLLVKTSPPNSVIVFHKRIMRRVDKKHQA